MFKTIQFAVLIQLPFAMTLLCMDHTLTLSQRVLTEPYVWNILTQKDSYFIHATPVSKLPSLQMTPHIRSLIYLFTLCSSRQALPVRKKRHSTNLGKSSLAFDHQSNLLNPQSPPLSAVSPDDRFELRRLQVLMIIKNDKEALTRSLNHGVNGAGLSRESLLCLATRSARYELVEMLLKAGAAPNKASMSGKSPLLFAANNGNARLVMLLLEAGADRDKADANGQTPLSRAAFNNHKEVADLLLQAGAILEKADRNGATALDVALERAHSDIVNLLVRAGGGAKQLLRAVSVGDTRMVSLLLNAGVAKETVDSKRETALYKAAMNGREEVVNQLLAAGVEINKRASNGATPLFIAAMGGHAGIVSRLLRAGANADIPIWNGETPLFVAARFGHSDVVGSLLKAESGL